MTLKTENGTSSKTGVFYFAYGSNLSPYQMALRCDNSPSSSVPVAIVCLEGWRWFICERGYANVAELPVDFEPSDMTTVWGVLYNLTLADEETLDMYEGHDSGRNPHPRLNPDSKTQRRNQYLQGHWDYNKFYLQVRVEKWLVDDPFQFGISKNSKDSITVLVYVDELRLKEGRILSEYVGRMNRAIDESVQLGMPREWVNKNMRKWVTPGIYPPEGYVGTEEGYISEQETDEFETALVKETNGV